MDQLAGGSLVSVLRLLLLERPGPYGDWREEMRIGFNGSG